MRFLFHMKRNLELNLVKEHYATLRSFSFTLHQEKTLDMSYGAKINFTNAVIENLCQKHQSTFIEIYIDQQTIARLNRNNNNIKFTVSSLADNQDHNYSLTLSTHCDCFISLSGDFIGNVRFLFVFFSN